MGRPKISPENLGRYIGKIYDDYTKSVDQNVDEACRKVAQKAKTALRNGSQQFDTRWGVGLYSHGWRVSVEEMRRPYWWKHTYVIHNTKNPTMTHLTEYGHAQWYGGRANAYPHIEPVAEKVPQDLSEAAIDAVRRA